jgi:four helix bundle protein
MVEDAEWVGEPEEGSSYGSPAPKAHRNLRVWQAGTELADVIYAATSGFPTEERFGLAAQMRRAAVSVPSNIAEGAARASNAEFLRFLHTARGSLAELDTQMEIARRRGYMTDDVLHRLSDLIEEVGRTLQGLIARRRQIGAEKEARVKRM